MTNGLRKKWRDFITASSKKRHFAASKRRRRTFLHLVEQLEDRVVPTVLDLTTVGASGNLNGALFLQFSPPSTGSGSVSSFVKLSTNAAVEQGYNTDFRPVQFNEDKSSSSTRAIKLSTLPTVVASGGIAYYELVLDINQSSSFPNSLLSLDELRMYVTNSATVDPGLLHNYNASTHTLQDDGGKLYAPAYDLNPITDSNYVKLDSKLAGGSGTGDMVALVPVSLLGSDGNQNVYLYSEFGVHNANTSGFEEWGTAAVLPVGSISGLKFVDTNGNGAQDAGEPGLAGVTVFLDASTPPNGVLDAGEVSTVTAADGSFSFSGLLAGTYHVREVAPAGQVQTAQLNADVTLAAGQNASGVKFGNFKLISISGTMYEDPVGDGLLADADDPVLNSANPDFVPVTIQLFRGSTLTATTTTDATGSYTFPGVGPGTYTVNEVNPNGWIQTAATGATIVAISGVPSTNNNFDIFKDAFVNNNTLMLTTTQVGGGSLAVAQNSPSTTSVTLRGQSGGSFPGAGLQAIQITSFAGYTVNTAQVSATPVVLMDKQGNNAYIAGASGTTAFINSGSTDTISVTGGVNALNFSTTTFGVTFNDSVNTLNQGQFQLQPLDSSVLHFLGIAGNFQTVVGSTFNDTITGASNTTVFGGGGNDNFFTPAGGANMSFNGGNGIDVLTANSGNVSAISFTGTNADTFIANGANVTGVSFSGGIGSQFIANSGSVTSVSFTGTGGDTFIANGATVTGVSFTGGSGVEQFIANGGNVSSVSFTGSTGADTFIVNGATVTGVSFTGGSSTDTFIANSGSVSGVSFTGGNTADSFIANGASVTGVSFTGGTGNDAFIASSGNVSSISFNGGAGADAFVVNGANVTGVSFTGSGADLFIANSGTVNSVSFTGGTGSDQFIANGATNVTNVSFNGGASNDAFIATSGNVSSISFNGGGGVDQFIANGANVNGVSFTGTGSDGFIANSGTVTNVSFTGGNGVDQFIANGASTVSNISFNGGASNDAFIATSGNVSSISFNGGGGVDQFIANGANVNGVSFTGTGSDGFIANSGTVTNVSFTGGNGGDAFIANGATSVTNVSFTGGTGNDQFIANSGSVSSISFNGGTGTDSFIANGAAVNGVSFTGTGSDGFIANSGSVTNVSFTGGNGGDVFIANGATSVTNVSFTGGAGSDQFIATNGTVSSISFNGGTGTDAFIANGASVNGVSFTGTGSDGFIANSGTVTNVSFTGGNGVDQFIANGASSVSNVSFTGGASNDAFFASNGNVSSISFNGGAGTDAFVANGATVNGVSFTGTGADQFIANAGSVNSVSFTGGNGGDVFIASNNATVSNVSFSGGTGADSFVASNGAAVSNVSFNGGAGGPDQLVVNNANLSNATFMAGSGADTLFITNGATVNAISFTGDSNSDAFMVNGASSLSNATFQGATGSDAFVANNSTVTNLTFNGGSNTNDFVLDGGAATGVKFDAGSGTTTVAVGGNLMGTLAQGTGNVSFLFFGSSGSNLAQGNIVLAADAQLTAKGTSTGAGALDFSSYMGAGINLSLQAAKANVPQVVTPGLTLTFANPEAFTQVVGTPFADQIYGNDRGDLLQGAAMPDPRVASAATLVPVAPTQWELVVFAPPVNPTDHTYTTAEQAQIVQQLNALYAPFVFVKFTQNVSDIPTGTTYAAITFNQSGPNPIDTTEAGGVSDELDIRNVSLGAHTFVNVNGFLGGPGQPTNTSQNFVVASVGIAGHEVGHTLGLEHYDSFGPIGFGTNFFPGADTYSPSYPGPEAAFETFSHIIASPASVDSSLFNLVAGPSFGEREAIKLAFDEFANQPVSDSAYNSNNPVPVVQETAGAHTAQASALGLALAPIPVPNNEPAGSLYAGKQFNVAAVDVVGWLKTAGTSDYYAITGKKGDLITLQVYSQDILRPTPLPHGDFDANLTVLDASGNPIAYYNSTAFNDDSNNSPSAQLADPRIIDLRLPADGTYFVVVGSNDVSFPTGDYELFMYRFSASNPTSGNDLLVGGASNDILIGGSGNDTLSGGAGGNSLSGGGGTNTVQEAGATNYTLTNSLLTSTTGTDTLQSISNAALTGAASGTTFDIRRWSGTDTLNVPGGLNAVLTPRGAAINVVEGQMAPAATFTDGGTPVATNYTATVDWGDNSSSSASATASGSLVTIKGNHAYEEGSYIATTTFSQGTAFSVIVDSPVSVADGALTPASSALSKPQGLPLNIQVATFTDADPVGTISDFTTSINWGDGTTSAGTVTQPGGVGTTFVVTGSHTYRVAGADTVTVTINDVGGQSATTSFIMTVQPSLIILNPTASGALTVTGSTGVGIAGAVFVDSNSTSALTATGGSRITASTIQVVGGVAASNGVILNPTPTTGVAAIPDPLAGLAAPAGGANQGPKIFTSSATLAPGVYSQISVSGNGTILTLSPGIYIVTGGGFSIANGASVSGTGVVIYNAGSNFPNPGGTFGAVSLGSSGAVNLSAPTSGPYTGILIFQARDNARTISLSASSAVGLLGTIYGPAALLSLGGSSTFANPAIVNLLTVNGNGGSPLLAAGSDAGSADADGRLLRRDLFVYLNNSSGSFTAAEQARLQDTIHGLDSLLAPYNVHIAEVANPASANLVLDTGPASASGTLADGVLGNYTPSTPYGEITIIQGWNWYAGPDPSVIGPGQYDFQTVVTHELGHALGLGHSEDPTSVMFDLLATGATRRSLTAHDLNLASAPTTQNVPEPERSLATNVTPIFLGVLIDSPGDGSTAFNGPVAASNNSPALASAGAASVPVAQQSWSLREFAAHEQGAQVLQSGRANSAVVDELSPEDVLDLFDVGNIPAGEISPNLLPAIATEREGARQAAVAVVLQERTTTQPAVLQVPVTTSVEEGYEGTNTCKEDLAPAGLAGSGRRDSWETRRLLAGFFVLSTIVMPPELLERRRTDRLFAELGRNKVRLRPVPGQ